MYTNKWQLHTACAHSLCRLCSLDLVSSAAGCTPFLALWIHHFHLHVGIAAQAHYFGNLYSSIWILNGIVGSHGYQPALVSIKVFHCRTVVIECNVNNCCKGWLEGKWTVINSRGLSKQWFLTHTTVTARRQDMSLGVWNSRATIPAARPQSYFEKYCTCTVCAETTTHHSATLNLTTQNPHRFLFLSFSLREAHSLHFTAWYSDFRKLSRTSSFLILNLALPFSTLTKVQHHFWIANQKVTSLEN